MEIPSKSLNCGFAMPVFGMGTWGMGGYMQHDPQNDDFSDTAALQVGLDLGFTHIDTAEIYAGGHAEAIIEQAIAGRNRSDLFITSKVWTNHLSYDGVRIAAEGSLKRLGTDYLDLYLIHQVDEKSSLEETIRGLDRLQEEGIIRNIGVSNFAVERMRQAQSYSMHKIVANQVHYNLVFREPELELLKYCQDNDVMLIAWRPVQAKEILQAECALMKHLCAKYRKTPAQIAINWLVAQPNVTTVAAMRSAKHIPENLAAIDFSMEREDLELLRREFPGCQFKSDALPLR
jgi:diketogulonate reductase-like aldo/keto reductase